MSDDDRAAEAFGTLGDPTRIEILRTFAETLDDVEPSREWGLPTLSFSEVYERAEVDSTSRLSYHLDELDGKYLRATDDGWRFTFAGHTIVRTILSGAYAGGIEFDPVETPGECPYCAAESLTADVEQRALVFECSDCNLKMGGVPVTPAQVRERDPGSLVESTTTRAVCHFRQFRKGVCNECGGIVDHRIEGEAKEELPGTFPFLIVGRCRQCWWKLNGPPSMWVANHPASVAFHWENDVDVLSIGPREVGAKLRSGEWSTERVGTDPDEYEVTYRVEDNVLRMTVDDDLELLRSERVRRN
jgi:hypothetical protein